MKVLLVLVLLMLLHFLLRALVCAHIAAPVSAMISSISKRSRLARGCPRGFARRGKRAKQAKQGARYATKAQGRNCTVALLVVKIDYQRSSIVYTHAESGKAKKTNPLHPPSRPALLWLVLFYCIELYSFFAFVILVCRCESPFFTSISNSVALVFATQVFVSVCVCVFLCMWDRLISFRVLCVCVWLWAMCRVYLVYVILN